MAVRRWSFLMPAQDHRGMPWLMARYQTRLTGRGRTVLWASCLAILLASPGTQVGAFLVLSVALGALFAAWLMSYLSRPDVVARRQLPPPPTAGQTLRYRVRVCNRGRHPLRALQVAEGVLPNGVYRVAGRAGGSATVELLQPGEAAELNLVVRCPYRGAFDLKPLLVGSSFPSGLVRRPRAAGDQQRLLVYPSFITQHELELPVGRRYQPGGITVSSKVGDSTEFFGTREYREGDRLRDIHWPSYARSGRLIVKEYREEYFVRVGLVLDTELPGRQQASSFERRVSLAAGIADAVARRDHIIDLFAAGERLYHLQAGRALARLEHVLELLACVEPSTSIDFDAVWSQLQQEAGQLSSIVVLLWDWDEQRARICRQLREAGAGVRPIVVRDQPPTLIPEPSVVVVPASAGEEMLQ
jgi:uncharacterized protein (DUF58 family)